MVFIQNMKKKKKEICSACGTSQMNHNFLYYSQVIDKMIEKATVIFYPFFFLKNNRSITDIVEKIFINTSHVIGVLRYDSDIEKALTGRSKVIWQEAKKRGIEMKQIKVFGKHIDNYKAKMGKKTIYFQSIPVPPWMTQKGYDWVDDKLTFTKKFREAGIPAPATRLIKSEKDIAKIFNELEKPIIVKPRFGSRGRHTTTNINTVYEMKKAYKLARQISPSVIAQEHLFGSVYRATVVNNKLVGFFRADPPQITGDGVKSIKELIEEKNKNRNVQLSETIINEELLNFIKRQNFTLEIILPKNITIDLLAKTGRLYGGYTKEIFPEIHPKIHSIFECAGKLAAIPVAGFDFIIADPTKDPDTQRCGIIECNSLPFIDLHYFALEGKPVNIASYIWDLWEQKKEVL